MNDRDASFTHVDALSGLLSVNSFNGADLDVAMRASLEVSFRGELEISRKVESSKVSRAFNRGGTSMPISGSHIGPISKSDELQNQEGIIAASNNSGSVNSSETVLLTPLLLDPYNSPESVVNGAIGQNLDDNNENSADDSDSATTEASSSEDEKSLKDDFLATADLSWLKPLPEGIPPTRAVSRRWENLNNLIRKSREIIEGQSVSREIVKVFYTFVVLLCLN